MRYCRAERRECEKSQIWKKRVCDWRCEQVQTQGHGWPSCKSFRWLIDWLIDWCVCVCVCVYKTYVYIVHMCGWFNHYHQTAKFLSNLFSHDIYMSVNFTSSSTTFFIFFLPSMFDKQERMSLKFSFNSEQISRVPIVAQQVTNLTSIWGCR